MRVEIGLNYEMGKLRSWFLTCSPVTAIFYVIHFLSISSKPLLSAVIITFGYIVAGRAYNLSFTANVS